MGPITRVLEARLFLYSLLAREKHFIAIHILHTPFLAVLQHSTMSVWFELNL